jgi:hypothetical protein
MVAILAYGFYKHGTDPFFFGVAAVFAIVLGIATLFVTRKTAREEAIPARRRESAQRPVPASTPPSKPMSTRASNPARDALRQAIAAKRKEDPLIGAKLGAKEVVQWLLGAFKDQKGVHVESFLAALGSLAGHACQASVRERNLPLQTVQGADGCKYWFGDALNKPLAEDRYSVWGLAAGAAQKNGCTRLPDVAAILKHVAATVGGPEFGIPRIPAAHTPGDIPANYVRALWPKLTPMFPDFCADAAEWPVLMGLALQEALIMTREALDPCLGLQIVMECAIPMSKIDFTRAS